MRGDTDGNRHPGRELGRIDDQSTGDDRYQRDQGSWPMCRDPEGNLLDSQMVAAPTPTAGMKATPKYQ